MAYGLGQWWDRSSNAVCVCVRDECVALTSVWRWNECRVAYDLLVHAFKLIAIRSETDGNLLAVMSHTAGYEVTAIGHHTYIVSGTHSSHAWRIIPEKYPKFFCYLFFRRLFLFISFFSHFSPREWWLGPNKPTSCWLRSEADRRR